MEDANSSMKIHSRCGSSGNGQYQAGSNPHNKSEVNIPKDSGEEGDHPEHAIASPPLPVLGQIR